jgi:hypothetical protein
MLLVRCLPLQRLTQELRIQILLKQFIMTSQFRKQVAAWKTRKRCLGKYDGTAFMYFVQKN